MSANTVLVGLIALALATCARGQIAGPTVEQVKALPACQGADVDTFAAKLSQPDCALWLQATMSSPCPSECAEAMDAAGEECFAAFLVFQYDYLGMPVSQDAATSYTNATFMACASGLANSVEAEVALGQAALASFPSCASADLDAAAMSNCPPLALLANLALTTECSPACTQTVKGFGADCLVDAVVAMLEKAEPGFGEAARSDIAALLSKCTSSARRLLRERSGSRFGELGVGQALAALAAAKPTLGLL